MVMSNITYVFLPPDEGLGFLHAICNAMNSNMNTLNQAMTNLSIAGMDGVLLKYILLLLFTVAVVFAGVYSPKLLHLFLLSTTCYFAFVACQVLGFPLLLATAVTCCFIVSLMVWRIDVRISICVLLFFETMSSMFQLLSSTWNVWWMDILSIALTAFYNEVLSIAIGSDRSYSKHGFFTGITWLTMIYIASCIFGPITIVWQLLILGIAIAIFVWISSRRLTNQTQANERTPLITRA